MTERASGRLTNSPTGTVTFLFTDIEGSTKMWEDHPLEMESALARHDEILRRSIEAHGGYVFKTIGDAYCAAFASSREATMATLASQRALFAEPWDHACPIKVRMALHTGATTERGGDYFGPPVNRVARLLSAGHGGQVLLSDVAYGLVRDILSHLEPGTELRYLGEHRLRDLRYTERIFQLVVPDLPADFPDLKTHGLVSTPAPPSGATPPQGEAVVDDTPPIEPAAPDDENVVPHEAPSPPEAAVPAPGTRPPKVRDPGSEDNRDRRKLINDRYRLLRPVGGGGMAEVYLARDEVLEREVAMKVLRGQYADDKGFVERFKREARNAGSLSHPNIVSIHDQGETEDGLFYIVMEHLEGGTLQDLIEREGSLPPGRVVSIAMQVSQALRAAHDQGMVHRDIKPQNILLSRTGNAKVGDFGIARAATATRVTQEGSVMGTAQYISPEQALGQEASARSDLYSLGIVMYEMLTGELPFDADTLAGIVMSHVSGKLRTPREANPGVSEELNAITVRLTAKDPEERYADASAVEADLEKVRRGEPLGQSADQPSGPGRMGDQAGAPPMQPGRGSVTGMIRELDSPPPGRPSGPPSGPPAGPPRSQRQPGMPGAPPPGTPTSVPPPGGPGGGAGRRKLWPWIAAAAGLVVVIALVGLGVWALVSITDPPEPQTASVPSLAGQTLAEAQETVGGDFEVIDDGSGSELDVVVSQEPQCGAQAEQGSDMSVTLGSDDPSLVEVPDLTGMPVEEVSGALESAGLNLGNVRPNISSQGQVVSQSPPACSMLSRGSSVSVTVGNQ